MIVNVLFNVLLVLKNVRETSKGLKTKSKKAEVSKTELTTRVVGGKQLRPQRLGGRVGAGVGGWGHAPQAMEEGALDQMLLAWALEGAAVAGGSLHLMPSAFRRGA